ncbi:MAG: hypothetical protein ACT4OE_11020 [Sphingosinicella sp.]
MSMFEYVIILISIVIGLALTHLMQGVANIIAHPKRAPIWWVHLVWVAYVLLVTVFWWWWQFNLQHVESWTFGRYLFVLGYAFLIYLMCVFLLPRDLEGYEGYQDYFLDRRHWFYGLMIALGAIDLIDTLLKGYDHYLSLGLQYQLQIALFAIGGLTGLVAKRPAIHAAVAVVFLAYLSTFVLRIFNTIA